MKRLLLLSLLGLLTYTNLQAREHPYFVNSISTSPNGRYIAIGRLDYKIILFDLEKREIIKVVAGKPGNEINDDTFFTPDSKHWVYQDKTFTLYFWNIETKKVDRKVYIDSEANGLVIFKDGKRMIWGGGDGRIEYINSEKHQRWLLKKPNPHPSFEREISDIILSPDESRFISVTGSTSNYDDPEQEFEEYKPKRWKIKHSGINLWDSTTLTKIKKLHAKDTSGKEWATFSPNSKYIYTTYENGPVHQWDAKDGNLIRRFDWKEGIGRCIGFLNSQSRWLGTTWTNSNELLIIEPINKAEYIEKKFIHKIAVYEMTTIPSKNLVITGDTDGSISVYQFDPEKLDIKLIWHPESVKSGIITRISPLEYLYKTPEEARKMEEDYIKRQKELGYGDDEEPAQKTGQSADNGPKDSGYSGVTLGPGV